MLIFFNAIKKVIKIEICKQIESKLISNIEECSQEETEEIMEELKKLTPEDLEIVKRKRIKL